MTKITLGNNYPTQSRINLATKSVSGTVAGVFYIQAMAENWPML